MVSQSGCYHAKLCFSRRKDFTQHIHSTFSVCNLNRSTFKSGKINQIKAERKGMLSLVTGKTLMPDCVISNIRIGQREFGSGD